jgi:hypothetical protein
LEDGARRFVLVRGRLGHFGHCVWKWGTVEARDADIDIDRRNVTERDADERGHDVDGRAARRST